MNAEYKTYPVMFLIALIISPVAGIQSLVQLKESLKIALRIIHRAWKPSHHCFIGR
jgi:hypothetical protein